MSYDLKSALDTAAAERREQERQAFKEQMYALDDVVDLQNNLIIINRNAKRIKQLMDVVLKVGVDGEILRTKESCEMYRLIDEIEVATR